LFGFLLEKKRFLENQNQGVNSGIKWETIKRKKIISRDAFKSTSVTIPFLC
jgi:hypothetical protein